MIRMCVKGIDVKVSMYEIGRMQVVDNTHDSIENHLDLKETQLLFRDSA